MHPLRALVCSVAVAAASVSLSGCAVNGSIDVTADDMATVDVTWVEFYGQDTSREQAKDPAYDPCGFPAPSQGLTATRAETPLADGVACHVAGVTRLQDLEWFGGRIVHVGDRYLAVFPQPFLVYLPSVTGRGNGDPSTIRVRLPGSVIAADPLAKVQEGVATWVLQGSSPPPGGLYATSETATGGVPVLALAALGGPAVGGLLAWAALRLRRPSDAEPEDDTEEVE